MITDNKLRELVNKKVFNRKDVNTPDYERRVITSKEFVFKYE